MNGRSRVPRRAPVCLPVLQFADYHESFRRPGSIVHLDEVKDGIEGCDFEAFALCSAGSWN